jgi:hypothetical protein
MGDQRTPKLVRVYADDAGETHLADLVVPGPAEPTEGGARAHGMRDVPTTTLQIRQLLERRPKLDLHPAPRRQLVIVLGGEFEITTTDGDHRRFGPGDCLFADDVEGKGHTHQDVGEDRLATVAIGVGDDWRWPVADERSVGGR